MKIFFGIIYLLFSAQLISQNILPDVAESAIYDNCPTLDCIESELNSYLRTCTDDNLLGTLVWESEHSVEFIIDEYGSTRNYKIINDYNSTLSRHLLGAVRNLKRWTPASVNGKPVESKYLLSMEVIGTIGSYKVRLIDTSSESIAGLE